MRPHAASGKRRPEPTALPGSDDVLAATLPNGLAVRIHPRRGSPTVAVEGLVHGGSLYEGPGEAGAANLVGQLLERGSRRRPFAALWADIEDQGAELGFGSGRHTLGFEARCLAEGLPAVLAVLVEMLAEPAFAPEQVALVRAEVLTGLAERDHDTGEQASLAFRRLVYGPEHPYGRDPEGGAEAVRSLSVETLAAWHARVLHPAGAILAVVGDVDVAACLRWVEDCFGAWRPPGGPPARPDVALPAPPGGPSRARVRIPGKRQADLVLGGAGLPRRHPDWTATALANVTLGVFGLMGRLGERVRDEMGLAYSVYSRLAGGLGPAPWYAAAGVQPRRAGAAVEAILDEVRRLQDELLAEEELADLQAYVTGALPLQLETHGGVARALVDVALYGLGEDYLRRFGAEVAAVTAADLQRAARRFPVETAAVAVAGP